MSNLFGEKLWHIGRITLAVGLSAILITGCSDDDDDDDGDSGSDVETGVFLDSPVSGISFATETQSGTTNEDGEFLYVEGETVTFSIGDITFPGTSADDVVTPLDLAGSTNPYDPVANNIARLLQSLDSDDNPDNGITIDSATLAQAEGVTIDDWSDTDAFETLFTTNFTGDLVSAADAADHLEDSLNEFNEQATLTLIGRFTGAEEQVFDDGAAEIVAFHNASQSIMVINAAASTVDILDASGLESEALANPLSASNLTLRSSLDVAGDVDVPDGFTAGGINSVAVQGNLMAVAVENDDKQSNGVVAFYSLNSQGVATFLHSVTAGALPDNVQISSDGNYAVVANEGEPNDDYSNDPEGTVTIIAITDGTPALTGTQVDFQDFNSTGERSSEVSDVRISQPTEDTTVAQDLEPEYVAFSSDNSKVYVSMQENNAIAVIDLAEASVDSIFGLGYKDHSLAGNGLDASNRDDAINIRTWDRLRGLYMPDSIAAFSSGGTNYVLTANEGDSREYDTWVDEDRVKDITLDTTAFPNAAELQEDENLGRLTAIITEGDSQGDEDYDYIYSFGARSFSIFNADTGSLVFDSGDDFERITATILGTAGFNATDNENEFDNRSDDKGPEPEAIAVGTVGSKRYAFIGLERTGGIMVYDISTPSSPKFVQYTINRDFTVDVEIPDPEDEDNEIFNTAVGDLAPEGFKFVSASNSPTGNALLIVGNEVSGTTTVYEMK